MLASGCHYSYRPIQRYNVNMVSWTISCVKGQLKLRTLSSSSAGAKYPSRHLKVLHLKNPSSKSIKILRHRAANTFPVQETGSGSVGNKSLFILKKLVSRFLERESLHLFVSEVSTSLHSASISSGPPSRPFPRDPTFAHCLLCIAQLPCFYETPRSISLVPSLYS